MSKDNVDEAFDLPPPYSNLDPASVPPQPSPSIFSSHLASLRASILADEIARASARDERDNQLLALLLPHVEHILSSISAMSPAPSLAEAIIIPEDAADEAWKLSDEGIERPGAVGPGIRSPGNAVVTRVVRVRTQAKKDGSSDRYEPPRETSDWAWTGSSGDDVSLSPTAWWTDEALARRLARSLQPKNPISETAPRPPPQQSKPEKSSRWKLFGGSKPSSSSSSAAPDPRPQWDNEVAMTVKAEEVTFRKENDFGIWESKTGWGLVMRVRLLRLEKSTWLFV
ncbi:hypothetical protein B0I35DRAFT_477254 [Stachybotrys elegans]|uniref:Uncharacterized protein n=1 Tax=Stachybotrys elegans TaxID=80388 RepID=A0A8K0SV17_9HYPO|nr:hypothetical protein B0I35DRAFT_477254 [Stachybotrys elegans]